MSYKIRTRLLACFLCLCLMINLVVPVAAAQESEDVTIGSEDVTIGTPSLEEILEGFEDVPVGDPASEENGIVQSDESATTDDDGVLTEEPPAVDDPVEGTNTADSALPPSQDEAASGDAGIDQLALTNAPATLELGGVSYILIDTEAELANIGKSDVGVPGTEEYILGILPTGNYERYYAADEDYAIVADITLTAPWTPLDFCGTMIGAEVVETPGTWGSTDYSLVEQRRTISDITVDGSTTSANGVGFFGALYSKGNADEMEKSSSGGGIIGSIIGGLVRVVAGLLGTVTGPLKDVAGLLVGWEDVTALGFEAVTVKNLILDGVTLPDSVAGEIPVGAFAGQISGNVTVENCQVLDVSNITGQQWAGGFVGKTVGATSYLLNGTLDGLNSTLGGLGTTVDGILNVLLPTEDVLGNLIDNLGVDKLVPVGYDPVILKNCTVSFTSSGGEVTAAVNYAGGFAGRLQGTQLTGCSVTGIRSVTAFANVGGFAGRINNAPIVGLLQGLGVNLVDFPAGCVVTDCVADGEGLTVTSTQTVTDGTVNLAYAGGFAGAVMASTITISADTARCGVTGLQSVTANGDYVGGFAGYAGIGDLAEVLNLLDKTLNLELKDDGSLELGTGVTEFLDKVLGVNLDAGVLSLIGIKASQMAGCSVAGDYAVSGGKRVGGFVGYLQGGQIVEQVLEQQYSRTQLTDSNGSPVYVSVDDIVTDGTLGIGGGDLISGVYGRLVDGQIVLEDVHGNVWNISPVTDVTGKTVYHVYDSVYLDADGSPVHTATFRDENWSALLTNDGEVISNKNDLPDANAVVPVYQQVTNSLGQVRFTYHSTEGDQIVYRDNSDPSIFYDEAGQQVTITNANGLASDTLQMAVEDQLGDSGTVTANYLTEITGLRLVKGSDYVGGVVGQATLASAVDLVSSLTVVQYERFELNNVTLTGVSTGYSVTATGDRAGGAVGYAMGGDVVNVTVSNLASVQAASYAGGFGGQIIPGTVAGQDGNGLQLLGLVTVSNLLTVIDAIHTFVSDSSVSGIAEGFTVIADNTQNNSAAAGFVAWSINSKYTNCTVSNLRLAEGDGCAGGFCAVADTGSIAEVMGKTFEGLDVGQLLGLNKLLSLLESFPNRFTGCMVNVGEGNQPYTVRASAHAASNVPGERINAQNRDAVNGTTCGSGGGFVGYGTAIQVENCANENLLLVDATSYAGGFGGYVTIGSVAQLGNAGILGQIASVTGIAALLDCAASILKTSYCQGASGGYTVTAFDRVSGTTGSWTDEGMAGGFIGNFEGSHMEGCYANHIDTVRGEEYAGGFLGRMVPGDVAKVANGTSLINDIIKLDGGLLSALQVMVPSVKNSYAKCVPCGGTVLAYGTDYADTTGTTTKIGVAGGYVGLNAGGQIWGNDENADQVTDRAAKTADHSGNAAGYEQNVYGTGQTCDILQLLKVDATLYAGGYSGYTKAADVASLGDINLLDGLVDLGNLLSVGQVVVPTQRNTGVTGPLRNVTAAQMQYFQQQTNFTQADFTKYYGYTVGHDTTEVSGGYCGVMTTGVIEGSIAYDLISSEAIQQSGGFVGAMLTGGVAQADLESSLLGGLLSGVTSVTGQLLGVVNAIVPVVKTSGVYGYYSGSQITAHNGSAGGFAGTVKGGQIWGEADAADFAEDSSQLVHTYSAVSNHCFTKNLRSVTASGSLSDAGGYVGYMGAASVANVGGLDLLGIITVPTDLLTLLSATVPTVYYADVSAVDDWGFYVSGNGGRSAGGFAGFLQGAQVGMKYTPAVIDASSGSHVGTPDETILGQNVSVTGLRSVTGGDYAGGFFGYADAAETLDVSAPDEGGSNENFTLLGLVNLGGIAAIELAKSYIYNGSVTGIVGGYQVETTNAYAWKTAEWNEDKNKAACAGGFGGLLQAGIVRYCAADALSLVSGKNYAGGFVARMGKSSIIKVDDVATSDNLGILSTLLTLGIGVGDVFGSHIQDSNLKGVDGGYSVLAQNGYHEIAGGFVGYADVCRITNCNANYLRLVMSDEIAGGFMGAMSDAMLISLDLGLLKAIWNGIGANIDLLKVNRSKIETVTVTGVDTWDGYDVYGGGSSETSDANTTMGYAGAFLGLNFGSTVTKGNAVYADTVKGTIDQINPYVGTQENTALLTNLQLDVLAEILDVDGWLSKSEIEQSTFQTRTGSETVPSAAATVVPYDNAAALESLPTPYYVAPNEADLMVQTVTHTLTVTKQLQYEDGAIPNIGDLDYTYTIQIYNSAGTLVHTAVLHPGESTVLNNPADGTYTIQEVAASVLPGNIIPAETVSVTVTGAADAHATVVNTVVASGQAPPDDTGNPGGHVAASGKFIVNHIPTDGQEPEEIEHPCEILNEIPDAAPIAERQVNSIELSTEKKTKRDPDEDSEVI